MRPATSTVTPVKNSNKLNGITVGDIAAIQQHVANTVLIDDPYRQAAADVNKNNSITTFDATIINQALLSAALREAPVQNFVALCAALAHHVAAALGFSGEHQPERRFGESGGK